MRSALTCFGCDFRRERIARLLVWLAVPGTFEILADTTIYVGKHFEVRNHDQPTKYFDETMKINVEETDCVGTKGTMCK